MPEGGWVSDETGLSRCHPPPLTSIALAQRQESQHHARPGPAGHINNPQGCMTAPTKGYGET